MILTAAISLLLAAKQLRAARSLKTLMVLAATPLEHRGCQERLKVTAPLLALTSRLS